MNASKSSRYNRARRRTASLWAVVTVLFLVAVAVTGVSVRLRALTGSILSAHVMAIALAHALVTLPIAFHRGYRLERQYGLSQASVAIWMRDYVRTSLFAGAVAMLAAEIAYGMMSVSSAWWWAAAAGGITGVLGLLTIVAPMFILPLFHRYKPLEREGLRRRLIALAARSGISGVNLYEWRLADGDRRAHAALIGAGGTQRIVLSDTLLAEYTEDEIEAIVAHEIGHYVHRDVLWTSAAELVTLASGFYAGGQLLQSAWRALALHSASDPAGVPVLALGCLAVWLPALPLLNALSRWQERRADRFALELTRHPHAFIAAVRRMAAHNLAEEHPSRAVVWWFHTHPPVHARISAARQMVVFS